MNAVDDPMISEEAAKGLAVFLISESRRHSSDLEHIDRVLTKLKTRFGWSTETLTILEECAERYVRFKHEA